MVTVFLENCNIQSQEDYDNIVNDLNICSLTCTCGCVGNMVLYGKYKRSLRVLSTLLPVFVRRVQCKHCGRTHAVLLGCWVPYQQIPLEDQIQIVLSEGDSDKTKAVLDENNLIDESEIYRIRLHFKSRWKERLRTLALSLSPRSPGITEHCIREFRQQFMQNHRGPTTYFFVPT